MIERRSDTEGYPTIYESWPKRRPRLDEVVTRIFKESILPQYQERCRILKFDHHASIDTWFDVKRDTLRTSFRRSILPPVLGQLPDGLTQKMLVKADTRLNKEHGEYIIHGICDARHLIVRIMIWSDCLYAYWLTEIPHDKSVRKDDQKRRIITSVFHALKEPQDGVEIVPWPDNIEDFSDVYHEVMRDAPAFSKADVDKRIDEREEELNVRIERQWRPLPTHPPASEQPIHHFVMHFTDQSDCQLTMVNDAHWESQWVMLQSDPAPLQIYLATIAGTKGSGLTDNVETSSLACPPVAKHAWAAPTDVRSTVFLRAPLNESLQERIGHALQNKTLPMYWERVDDLLDASADLASAWCGLTNVKSLLCLATACRFGPIISQCIEAKLQGTKEKKKGYPPSALSIASKFLKQWRLRMNTIREVKDGEMDPETRKKLSVTNFPITEYVDSGFVKHVWRRLHFNELKGTEAYNLENFGAFMSIAMDHFVNLIVRHRFTLDRADSTPTRNAKRASTRTPDQNFETLKQLRQNDDPEGVGSQVDRLFRSAVVYVTCPSQEQAEAHKRLVTAWDDALALTETHNSRAHEALLSQGMDGFMSAVQQLQEDHNV
ncbi:hypothetical protein O3669_08300 [Pauljensenia sp. 20925_1_34]|jgi:hypothetical protein|uniref:hypothetical protein n=1 Tax=Pauljensenia sp. 20925_1_34 TaxID=3003674 RepID=UPI00352F27FE